MTFGKMSKSANFKVLKVSKSANFKVPKVSKSANFEVLPASALQVLSCKIESFYNVHVSVPAQPVCRDVLHHDSRKP